MSSFNFKLISYSYIKLHHTTKCKCTRITEQNVNLHHGDDDLRQNGRIRTTSGSGSGEVAQMKVTTIAAVMSNLPKKTSLQL